MLASVHQCNYIYNRLPSTVLPSNVAPMTVFTGGKVQSLSHAKVFGCQVTSHLPRQLRGDKTNHHMDPTGKLGVVHCGVSQEHKGYVIYYPEDDTFNTVLNLSFQENVYPLRAPIPPPPEPPPPKAARKVPAPPEEDPPMAPTQEDDGARSAFSVTRKIEA